MPSADELLPYLRRIDQSRWYTNFGPLVGEFERALAASLEPRSAVHVTTVANGTLGLELALAAAGLSPGARVLIPALTFVASAMAVRRAGCVPVLADVDPASWQLTPGIARLALERTVVDCIMPVAAFGAPQDAGAWDAFSAETGIAVVIDAAAAFGNQKIGRRALTVFSLHATKSLGAGEGGFVASLDAGLTRSIRQMSNFGIDVATGHAPILGGNAKLSEYHAAVGLAALARWRTHRERRVDMAREYSAALLTACPGISLQERPTEGVYTILPLCLPGDCDAEQIRSRLAARGIETRRWYVPLLFEHPSLANTSCAGGLEVCRDVAGRLLGVPLHLALSRADRARVCSELAGALGGRQAA